MLGLGGVVLLIYYLDAYVDAASEIITSTAII